MSYCEGICNDSTIDAISQDNGVNVYCSPSQFDSDSEGDDKCLDLMEAFDANSIDGI